MQKRRSRLSPEVRKDLILDDAARLILEDGMSAVSMMGLGRKAGVSKALIYAYFPTRHDVFSALLAREYERFKAHIGDIFEDDQSMEDSVTALARAYIQHKEEYDLLIERLTNEPEIAKTLEGVDATGRSFVVDLFGRKIAKEYHCTFHRARIIANLLIGLFGRADTFGQETNADREALAASMSGLAIAALRAVAAPNPAHPVEP